MVLNDTIFALATPATAGERGVVRLSGPDSFLVLERLAKRALPRERRVVDVDLQLPGKWSSSLVLPARLLLFTEPSSYTGEDVIEVHTCMSPSIAEFVEETFAEAGLRPATAGEFTRRAFENGKLGLGQAEAVLALIQAEDDAGLRRAARWLRTGIEEERSELREQFVDLIALLESGLDFEDQETGAVEPELWVPRLEALIARMARNLEDETRPSRSELPSYVLVGPPNAGKTSLWNALRALYLAETGTADPAAGDGLVSSLAGTTRDLRWTRIGPLRIGDAPGREDWLDGAAIEVEGRGAPDDDDLAILKHEIEAGDGFLWLTPSTAPATAPPELGRPALCIATQIDRAPGFVAPRSWYACSSLTGAGIADLRAALERLGARGPLPSPNQDLRRCLRAAREAARRALDARDLGDEVVVAELACAVTALAPSDAPDVPEELLDRIFARFCLGK